MHLLCMLIPRWTRGESGQNGPDAVANVGREDKVACGIVSSKTKLKSIVLEIAFRYKNATHKNVLVRKSPPPVSRQVMSLYCVPVGVVDGGWTRWTEWNECSVTCGNGTQSRLRTCTDPVPMYGGKDCRGESLQVRNCFPRHCPGKAQTCHCLSIHPSLPLPPVHCVWEPWSEWTSCSRSCGGGLQVQTREKQVEKYGGRPCEGLPLQNRSCNTHFCPSECTLSAHTPYPLSIWLFCSKRAVDAVVRVDRLQRNMRQRHQVAREVLHCTISTVWWEELHWASDGNGGLLPCALSRAL